MNFLPFLKRNKNKRKPTFVSKKKSFEIVSPKVFKNREKYGSQTIFFRDVLTKRRVKTQPKTIVRKYNTGLRNLFIFLCVTCLFGYLIYIADQKSFLKVSKVEVSGAKNFVSNGDISHVVESNSLGKNILSYNTIILEDMLVKTFLGAKDIQVRKSLPDTLQVTIYERVPLAVIYKDTSSPHFLIDEEGFVIGEVISDFMDLPNIRYEDEVSVGQYINKDIIPISSEILRFSTDLNMSVKDLSLGSKYLHMFLNEDIEVYMSYDKDRRLSLDTISTLINESKLEEKHIKRIDLRYDKVIVLYD